MRLPTSALCTTIVALCAACAPEPSGFEAAEARLARHGQNQAATRLLTVVAHQDDDFLVTAPDLQHAIEAGAAAQTVVLTAGENNPAPNEDTCDAYVRARELGQRLAWEAMAGEHLAGDWGPPALVELPTGLSVRKFSMPGRPLSIVYVGLRNSFHKDLETLWNDHAGERAVTTRPDPELPTQTYTRAGLLASLRALIDAFAPTHVSTLDAGKTKTVDFPLEHSDHVHGALFTLAALAQRPAQGATSLRMYRSYNAVLEPPNLSSFDAQRKRALYEAYAPHDAFLCEGALSQLCSGRPIICNNPLNLVYEHFHHRQYPVYTLRDVSGPLRGPRDGCVSVQGQAAPGAGLGLSRCAADAERWAVQTDGTLRHLESGLCVSYVGDAPRGAALQLVACDPSSLAQRFLLTGWAQLRGPDATCVSAADPARLALVECADREEQLGFVMQFAHPLTTSSDFDESQLASRASQAGSLAYGDLDGDQDDDVCVRRPDGVYCASNEGQRFGRLERRLAGFADPTYDSAQSGGTLALADVNGDGRADACLRSERGIECADGDGSGGFGSVSARSSAFDRWSGFGSHVSYFGSIRFVDLDADGKADVCGRNRAGIECALASQAGDGTFAPPRQWLREEFSDALGWFLASTGSTIQFGDVDGDGRPDVCGRGSAGVLCATNNGRSFERPHRWSAAPDFSDAAGFGASAARYGSLRLGDLNGDGLADLCGRDARGVLCALSLGQAFGPARRMLAVDPFTDARGYGSEAYGGSLALLRLDADTRMDLCLRGPRPEGGVGLICAASH